MQHFRELTSVTQNSFSSIINPNNNSDGSFVSALTKLNSYRGNMAIATDMYLSPLNRHNSASGQFGHSLQYHPNSLPQGLHGLQNSTSCHVYSGYTTTSPLLDVWSNNFVDGWRAVRRLTKASRYVAVDTEFPGVIAKVFGEFLNSYDQAYQNIKVNIDLLRPIQIGFSFFNDRGQCTEPISTIQFNLKWNVDIEAHAVDSIKLLQDCGIDFYKLKRDGIELNDFGEAFIGSGLVFNNRITWVGFHSAYDFAYMMKLCTDWPQLPENFKEFFEKMTLFFPQIADLKTIMNQHRFTKGGLQELADSLKVSRYGLKHQAGSDSMLTGETFFRFLQEYCNGVLNPEYVNLVFGLNFCPSGAMPTAMASNGSILHSPHKGVSDIDISPQKMTHSADHSGRTSPEGSVSGHRSS